MMELRYRKKRGSSIGAGLQDRHQRQQVYSNYFPQPFWHSYSTSLDVPGGANLSGTSVVVKDRRVRFRDISAHAASDAGVDKFAIGSFDRSSACKVEPMRKRHLYASIWLQLIGVPCGLIRKHPTLSLSSMACISRGRMPEVEWYPISLPQLVVGWYHHSTTQ